MAILTVPVTDLSLQPRALIEIFAYLCDIDGNKLTEETSQGLVVGPARSFTDDSGVATFDLIPNDEIDRDGTYYAIDVAGSIAPVIILKTSATQTLSAARVFSPAALGSPAGLGNLFDVDLAGLAAGNGIRYSAGKWVPWPWPSGGGGSDKPWVTVSSNTTLVAADSANKIKADAAGGPITLILPTAAGNPGIEFTIKRVNSGSNTVTIVPSGGQGIDGQSSLVLTMQWEALTLSSDNSNWMVT